MDKKITIQIPPINIEKYLKEFPKIKRRKGILPTDNVKTPMLKHQIVETRISKKVISLPPL